MEREPPRPDQLEEDSKEYKKALLFIRSGDLDKAREILEEYCALNTRSARAFNKLAFVYLETGNLDAAEGVLTRLLEAGFKDFYTHFLYGRLLMRRGDVTNAVVHFTTALTINPKDVYTLNGVAEALLIQGDRAKAIRCLRKAIELAPGDVMSYQSLAQLFLDHGQPDEAKTVVDSAVANDLHEPRLLFLKGRCLTQRGDLEGARKLFEELAEKHPGQAWGKLGLGLLADACGAVDEAVRLIGQAVAAEPRNIEACVRHSAALSKQGEKEKALAAMEKALALSPFDLRIQTMYARALYERRLILKAWLNIQTVLTQDSNYAPARLLKAALFLDEELPRNAMEETTFVLEKDPTDLEAITLHAECKALLGAPDEAEAIANRAVADHGSTRGLRFALALALRARRDSKGYGDALRALDDGKICDRVATRVRKLLAVLE